MVQDRPINSGESAFVKYTLAPAFDIVNPGPIRLKYLILSTPRSGSTMLSAALSGSRFAGAPSEYFHKYPLKRAGNPELYPNGLNTYFDGLLSRRTTANGVFGMKLHFSQFQRLFGANQESLSYGMAFLMQFDRFIITSRQDKILQAISLIFASESDTWNTDSESSENLNGRDFRQDDTMKICNSMRSLTSNESSWRKLMKKMNITPFDIVYENMCDQPNKTFQKLKDYLKIPELEHVELEASTFKITDPLKALDMKQRFLQDIRALNTSIPDPD